MANTVIQLKFSEATATPASLNVALTADTTNGSLKVDVTGVLAQTIRWSIYIRTQEVTN